MATIHREGNLDLLSGKVAVVGYGSQGHAHALNLHDSGVEVVVGLREGSSSRAAAEDAGVGVASVGEAVRDAQVVSLLLPDQVQPRVYEEDVAPNLAPDAALLFARVQRPLRTNPAAGRTRRDHGRAEGPGAHRPPPLRGGVRDAGDRRRRPGCERRRVRARARVRGRDRRRSRWDDRDLVRGGDGDRSLRRAGGAVRRRDGARPRRVRDPRRGRLPARDRVLRVPPRAEAHRRPHLGRRALRNALLGVRHGRVRRSHTRPRDRRARPRTDEGAPRRHPVGRVREGVDCRDGRGRTAPDRAAKAGIGAAARAGGSRTPRLDAPRGDGGQAGS